MAWSIVSSPTPSALLLFLLPPLLLSAGSLEEDWADPPLDARVRAYWWWLNGCVTKEAITRDLEEMKSKGFGGALICDADGSAQDGNDRAPHGPTFFSPEWRELYKHTLREAARLGLEMSLNIQSGWNLGGPMVTADDAAKKLVWSETRVTGPAQAAQKLTVPAGREGYYRDAFVVAYRLKDAEAKRVFAGIKTQSQQRDHTAAALGDGDPATFWASAGGKAGDGPSAARPEWVQFEFAAPVRADRLTLQPRPGYGPRDCELQVSADGASFQTLQSFVADAKKETVVTFEAAAGLLFRVRIASSNDPRFPDTPRNVQVAEMRLSGPDGSWPDAASQKRTLQHWEQKAGHKPLHFSAPDTRLLFEELPAEAGEEDTRPAEVVDLTAMLGKDGVLRWEAPAGLWQVLRFGCTIGDHSRVSTCSEGWEGYALDVLDTGAFQRYWDAVVEPLLADAGEFAGKTLKYLHTDSWEVEPLNWTFAMREEFRQRRGYDLTPWAPVLAGRIVESRAASNRFLHDFRKTLGDLAIDHHYLPFREGARRHGLLIHPESGGPHAVPIDAQRCLGTNDAPMSEFWAWSWRHRIGDENRFFVKQPASAAHTYGHKLVLAEGFTTIGPHWQETLWDNLKPSFDKACCEGLNLLVWHAFVCSPPEQGTPGLQYFAGTHLNPNVTWWTRSEPFFRYLNRCQALLQRGLFVADACYYYGDHVPNFAQHKRTDPARVLPGFDYDVITEEALLTRAGVQDGRIVLPGGMSYRVLVLRDQPSISLPVLRKIKELADAGATVAGPVPGESVSLAHSSEDVRQVASRLRIVTGKSAREVLMEQGVPPDFECRGGDGKTDVDFLHRRDGESDIYFVASRGNRAERLECLFRVSGKAPELWDPVSGTRRFAPAYREEEGRTCVPLEFAPCGSWFVVFREPAAAHPASGGSKGAELRPVLELGGPWKVHFVPGMSTAERSATEALRTDTRVMDFAQLISWTEHPDPGIRYYSGVATYTKTFDGAGVAPPGAETALYLDLGDLRELAEVRLNGKALGITWAPPFRVKIEGPLKPSGNVLAIDVCNFWPNRIIGDESLPPEKRHTRTNIRKLTRDTALMPSGLFGPVRILSEGGAP